jgi:hypothetical protein
MGSRKICLSDLALSSYVLVMYYGLVWSTNHFSRRNAPEWFGKKNIWILWKLCWNMPCQCRTIGDMYICICYCSKDRWAGFTEDGEDEDMCLIIGCQLSFYSTSPLGWCERICGVCVVSCVATGGRGSKLTKQSCPWSMERDVCCPFAAWIRTMLPLPVAFRCSAGAHESYGPERGSLAINGPWSAIVISCFLVAAVVLDNAYTPHLSYTI